MAPRETRDRPVTKEGCDENCCEQLESENKELRRRLRNIFHLYKIGSPTMNPNYAKICADMAKIASKKFP